MDKVNFDALEAMEEQEEGNLGVERGRGGRGLASGEWNDCDEHVLFCHPHRRRRRHIYRQRQTQALEKDQDKSQNLSPKPQTANIQGLRVETLNPKP